MKWMRMMAVVTVTAALALGSAGCAKKADEAAQDTAAPKGGGLAEGLSGAAEKAEGQ